MNRSRNILTAFTLVAAFILGTASMAAAQVRNERDVRDAVRSLNSKLDDFETNLQYQMQSSSANNSQLADISDEIGNMRDEVQRFQDNLDRKRENRDDVNTIVDSARKINDILRANSQNRRVTDDWIGVQKQVDRLAANYGIPNNWQNGGSRQQQPAKNDPPYQNYPGNNNNYPVNNNNYPINNNNIVSVGLSGTYGLDRAKSESIDDIVADTHLGSAQGQDLRDKLEAPEQIAIDVRGDQVTLATTNASPITFTADGRDKVENGPNGKTVRLRATLSGDKLIVSSIGGETDYTITFTSAGNGKTLKVSRRITTDYLNQTVFAESVYNKTDATAQLGIPAGGGRSNSGNSGGSGVNNSDPNGTYSDNDQNGIITNGGSNNGSNTGSNTGSNRGSNRGSNGRYPTAVRVRPGNYVVPDGTMITGILDSEVSTQISQNNDPFRMTVQSPNEFRGATIEGYISGVNRSGKVTGYSSISFNFEKITLRNGQTYDFAGSLRGLTDSTGKVISVDNEGTARGESQTTNTAKRGGIGAGIGAVIGAIAGGGHGAILGAIIGGGAGAGSVAIQDRKDIQLTRGSILTVQAAAPQQNPR